MAEDIKYTVAEMEQLAESVDKLKGKLGKDFEQVFTNINVLLKEWNKSFGMGASEMEELLSISDELREKHDQMVDLGKKYAAELEKISNLESDFLRDNGISIEQAKERLKLKLKEADLNYEIALVNEKMREIEAERNALQGQLSSVRNDELGKAFNLNAEISKQNQEYERQQKILDDLKKQFDAFPDSVKYMTHDAMRDLENKIYQFDQAAQNVQDYSDKLQEATSNTYELAKATARWNRENDGNMQKVIATSKEVIGLGKAMVSKYLEIDHSVVSFGRTVGLSSQAIKSHKASILDHYDEMAARLGMTFEEIFKFQEQYTRNTGRAVILTNQQVESLAEMSKLTSAESVEKMATNMDEFGASTETATDYLALNMARARSQGLDAAKASEAFANNIKMASRYSFQEGINGVSKMTLLSQRLKFNMESISSSLDKFSTIEGAIETSANIQMLGGSYAVNFSNPLDAMSEALMDAEGFINRIVNTVSTQATFNRQTGMVEMSGFEKARLREFSKQMGLNYDDTWNMVAQQTKIQAMGRELGKGKWSETEEALIANKAQFNTEKNRWEIAIPGHETPTAITDLTSSMLEELKDVATLTDEDLKSDVHHIRKDLREFINRTVETDKSWQERGKGLKEAISITNAQLTSNIGEADFMQNGGNYLTNNWNPWLAGATIGGYGMYRIGKASYPLWKNTKFGKWGKDVVSKPFRRNPPKAKGKMGGGAASVRTAKGLKLASKSMKALGVVGLGVEAASSVYDIWDYRKQKQQLNHRTDLTQEQKDAALIEAKNARNRGIGSIVGGVIGGALGLLGGPGGVVAGATIGSMLGGGASRLFNSSSSSMTSIENTEIQNSTEQLALLTSIDTSVGNILKNRGQIEERVIAMSNSQHIVNNSKIGDVATMFNQTNTNTTTTQNSNLKHDLNISGTIKLQGDKGGQVSIDGDKLLNDNKFVTSITDMVVAALNMRSGQGGRVNKDTTQQRLGGVNSVGSQNLKSDYA